MALIATYNEAAGLVIEESELRGVTPAGTYASAGRAATNVRRKRKWTIVVTYDTPEGPQEVTVSPKKKCYLAQISPAIELAIRQDAAAVGWVKNISWKATGL